MGITGTPGLARPAAPRPSKSPRPRGGTSPSSTEAGSRCCSKKNGRSADSTGRSSITATIVAAHDPPGRDVSRSVAHADPDAPLPMHDNRSLRVRPEALAAGARTNAHLDSFDPGRVVVRAQPEHPLRSAHARRDGGEGRLRLAEPDVIAVRV